MIKFVVWSKVGCGGAHYICSCEGVQALECRAFSSPLQKVQWRWCLTVVTLTEVEIWRSTVECQRTCTWPCMLHLMPCIYPGRICYVGWGPRHSGPSFDSILTCDHRQGLLCTGSYFSNLKQIHDNEGHHLLRWGRGCWEWGKLYMCCGVRGEQGVNGKSLCLLFNFALNLNFSKYEVS